jgi:hypothetical protein
MIFIQKVWIRRIVKQDVWNSKTTLFLRWMEYNTTLWGELAVTHDMTKTTTSRHGQGSTSAKPPYSTHSRPKQPRWACAAPALDKSWASHLADADHISRVSQGLRGQRTWSTRSLGLITLTHLAARWSIESMHDACMSTPLCNGSWSGMITKGRGWS